MRTKLVGWNYVRDAPGHIYPKEQKALDVLKAAGKTLSSEELAVQMGYPAGGVAKKAIEVVAYRLKNKGLIESVTEQVEGEVSKEMRLFLENSEAIKSWMRRLRSQETRDKFLFLFVKYFKWVQKQGKFNTPDELIAHKQTAQNDKDTYLHINLAEDYFFEAKLSSFQEKSAYTAIRSFYKHNKAALPSYSLNFRQKPLKPVVTQQPITLDELKILLSTAKAREKAIFLVMLQGGIDRSTLAEYFNFYAWPQITKQLGSEDPENWDLSRLPIRINLTRVKTRVEHYTFISVDAVKALQQWLNVRKTLMGKPMQNGEALFLTAQRNALRKESVSTIFNRLAIAAGLESKKYGKASEIRYRFHAHELRDTFRSACTVAGVAHPVAEYMIGHSIDKLGYDKSPTVYPEHFRAEYAKVEPMLNIFSNQAVDLKKLEELEAKIQEKESVIQSLIQNGHEKATEMDELTVKVNRLEHFLVDFQKAFDASNKEQSFLEKFEETKKERQQRDAALTEYVENHPELWFSSKKPSWEELQKVTKGFEEYYQKKKLKTKP